MTFPQPPPEGNQYAIGIKDPVKRQLAFKSYCQHLSEGYPKAAWSYRNEEAKCTWETMEKYIKNHPTEFEAFLKQEASCKSYKDWFDKGRKLVDGKIVGNPSPQTWATIMRNMFHWDKPVENQTTHRGHVVDLAEGIRSEPVSETETCDQDIE